MNRRGFLGTLAGALAASFLPKVHQPCISGFTPGEAMFFLPSEDWVKRPAAVTYPIQVDYDHWSKSRDIPLIKISLNLYSEEV